ncbi:1,3-beta-glucanosyltransferase [Erysiphe necator]|uniref:1,3-beta-glucanosyltransferase n=1 Tax=Uncinula necator TaxID=52586 RepID=A0A0B1P896_UNCNE|nr:1,3-beta-glucanosyltransferase [Erysiphe necator]KHJ34907.1 putative beta-glucanosyltransferase [Erysiphe necator]
MKLLRSTVSVLSTALLIRFTLADLQPIIIKGSHFFYENGTEFFIRGVAYQQDIINLSASSTGTTSYSDPLADKNACKRDIPLLQELGANVIRVYAIDPTADHSFCMKLLQDAGIYVIQDLSNPTSSINRDKPTWTTELFANYAGVIDALAKYSNVIGFFAGNEVSNEVKNTEASAFVKAAVRDMKSYIKAKKYRPMGVGYATNDDPAIRIPLAHYFNCGDPAESIDFWGYNIYSWCGDSSFTNSGYDQRTLEFSNYSVPAFFAEYGCNTIRPRKFTEVQAIYGDQMTKVWSGGIMYMYFQEANDYGLVTVSGDKVSKLPDFTALSKQLATVAPSNTPMSQYSVTNTVAQDCPATGVSWAASSKLPPIANADLCSCMMSSLSCTAKSGLSSNETATLFSSVCGLDSKACVGISANASTGTYGAYSMCLPDQQLSFAMDQYYKLQKSADSACNFGGNAKTQSSSLSDSCKKLLGQAGPAGTGVVTSAPTSTKGTSDSDGSSKKSGAGVNVVPIFNSDLLKIYAYLIVMVITGAGMVLL